ncbi:uncharacterized protein LOC144665000 [Oculina patagonica]
MSSASYRPHIGPNYDQLVLNHEVGAKANNRIVVVVKVVVRRLNNNHLTELPAGVFGRNPWLFYIDLSNNQLEHLSAGVISNLTGLQVLDLSNNPLEGLPSGIFRHTRSLQYLSLSDIGVQSLPQGILNNYAELAFLDLSYNDIQYLPKGCCSKPLRTLSLQSNQIESISNTTFTASIPNLFLNGNRLKYIPYRAFYNLHTGQDRYQVM